MESIQDYKITQLPTACLSHYAYLIESDGEAAIIDPMRDTQQYSDLLAQQKLSLKFVLETHFHADFVSGHLDLAKNHNATVVFGPTAKPEYEAKIAEDNEELVVGKIIIKVIHTPGHTKESVCYLLIHGENQVALFSGDTVFMNSLGRPDLITSFGVSKEELASDMYVSIHEKILTLDENILIYPGHGAGSACGKGISAINNDSLKNQKVTNPYFSYEKEEFINKLTENMPGAPQYFLHDAVVNKKGYDDLTEVIKRNSTRIPAKEVKELGDSVILLDTRDSPDFIKEHVPNSIFLSLKMPFAVYVGTVFSPQDTLVIICEEDKVQESITRLARIGYENVRGVLDGGLAGWKEAGFETSKCNVIHATELEKELESNVDNVIVDVREQEEWSAGIVENSKLLALSKLRANIQDLEKNKYFLTLCKTGGRALTFLSWLQKNGLRGAIIPGGHLKLQEIGVKLIKN